MAKLGSLNDYKRTTEKIYKLPKSVQQIIPINRISEEGIFELENNPGDKLYDKAYIFDDINFSCVDDDEQDIIADKFEKLLNSMQVDFKISVVNGNKDMSRLKDDTLLKIRNERFGYLINEYNEIIKERVKAKQGIEQVRYYTITCRKQGFEEAKAFFDTLEASLTISFKRFGSGIIPLDATERLRVLHNFYHLGHEDEFRFNLNESYKKLSDWRNDIVCNSIKEFKDYVEFDGGKRYATTLFARSYPSSNTDKMIREITNLNFPLIVTMDLAPIPEAVTDNYLLSKYSSIENSIFKQQQTRNKQNAFSTEISYIKRKEKEEIEEYLDEVRTFDQKLFFMGLYITIEAEDLKELKNRILSVKNVGSSSSFIFDEHSYRQLDAMHTSLPLGVRFVDTMRTIFTDSITTFMPFNVQRISSVGGQYYGTNQISKDLIIANRKKLKNGHGFSFGVTGSGKSMFHKLEIAQVLGCTNDDVIIIDPQNEYMELGEKFGGSVFKFEAESGTYLNPLDIPDTVKDDEKDRFIGEKAEFMFAVCEQIISLADTLHAYQISNINRAVKAMYDKAFNVSKKKRVSPTLANFRDELSEVCGTDDKKNNELVEALSAYIEGSLNMFSHPTNAAIDSRLIVFSIRNLGEIMTPLSMLIIMECIRTRLSQNYANDNDKAVWIYIDEIHVLMRSRYTFDELNKLWKEVRKEGGICTGMTQNVIDCLENREAMNLISNSQFTVFFEQGQVDRSQIRDIIPIPVSDALLNYVQSAEPGEGLLRFGDKIVPFSNQISRSSELYKLFNTDAFELANI